MNVRGKKLGHPRARKIRQNPIALVTQLRKEMELLASETTRHLRHLAGRVETANTTLEALRTQAFTSNAGVETMNRLDSLGEIVDGHTKRLAVRELGGQHCRREIEHLKLLLTEQQLACNARYNAFLREAGGIPIAAPPRTLKGGWINLYHIASDGTMDFNSAQGPFEERESADACANDRRIACIRLTDIIEGSGL